MSIDFIAENRVAIGTAYHQVCNLQQILIPFSVHLLFMYMV
jgi:hypothetical protein